jgi:hypothetical protein
MWRVMISMIASVGLLVLACACGDDDRGPADAGRDAGVDGGLGDAGGSDGGADAGPRACADVLAESAAFDVDPDGIDTQIHAAAIFDGERVRVVYDLPDEAGTFDVFTTTVECDGAVGTPARVNTTDANETDPVIARAGDRVLVAWSADDGTGGTDNMHAYYRVLALDGTALSDTDVELRTMREGAVVPDNHFASAVVALPSGGFAVAGVRALAAIDRFHAYAQEMDADGALVGEALEPIFEPGVGHWNATATVSGGEVIVAWDRNEAMMMDQVWLGGASGTPAPELAVDGLATTFGASLAADASDPSRVYAALAGDVIPGATDIRLTDVERPLAERPVEVLGAARVVDHSPVIAPSSDGGGGAVAYYRNVSGLSNRLIVQRFTYDGTDFTIGPELEVVSMRAAPYPPAITHVLGDLYFVAWSEGTSPAFRLRGRFVRAEG